MTKILKGLLCIIVISAIVIYGLSMYLDYVKTDNDSKELTLQSDVNVKSFEQLRLLLEEAKNNLTEEINVKYKYFKVEDINFNEFIFNDNKVANIKVEYSKTNIIIKLQYRSWFRISRSTILGNSEEVLTNEEKIVRDKVLKVIDENIVLGMTDYEKEKTIHDYIINNAKYSENITDRSHTIEGLLLDGEAVCQGYAEAFKLFMDFMGIECILIDGVADEKHEWNIVKIDGEYYHVDLTWNDPVPDMEGTVNYFYFNVNDEIMLKNRNWIREKYPQCTAMDNNYYVKNNLRISSDEQLDSIVLEAIHSGYSEIDIYCEKGYLGSNNPGQLVMDSLSRIGYSQSISYVQKDGYCKVFIK